MPQTDTNLIKVKQTYGKKHRYHNMFAFPCYPYFPAHV